MVAPTARKLPKFHPFYGRDIPWLVRMQAAVRADHTFLIWEPFEGEEERWTYREFSQQVDLVAAGLVNHGLQKSDYLLIHLDNCPEFLFTWFACAQLGVVAVTTNTRSSRDELTYFIEHSGVKAAVTQPSLLPLVEECGPNLTWIACTDRVTSNGQAFSFDKLTAYGKQEDKRYADSNLPISVQYTSGTTSRPKGVVWTHANALWAAKINAQHCELSADDVTIVVLPLFHTNALGYSTLGTMWAGGTMVLTPKFSASRFWPVSIKHKCTWASIIPFVTAALSDRPVPDHNYRFWAFGAADVAEVEQKFRIKTVGWWGMTETVSHGTLSYHHLSGPHGSIGVTATEYEIDIRDDRGESVDASPEGTPGRLYVRGTPGLSLFLEYLHDPDATASCFDADGWMDTGDIVKMRSDGYLIFGDRAKDMLKVGGENVAASEIERVISAMPEVKEAAVVAKPHKLLSEVPVAFVIAAADEVSGLEDKICARCTEMLADFKVPAEIILVDDLPRSLLNKVAKKELRARLDGR